MKNKILKNIHILLIGSALGFSGCSKNNSQFVDQASQSMANSLGCTQMKSLVFDSFYEMIDKDQSVPSASEMQQSLKKEMDQLKVDKQFSAEQSATMDQITKELFKVVDLMLAQNPDLNSTSWKEQIQKIIEFEMGDRSSEASIQAQNEIEQSLNHVKELSQNLDVSCKVNYKPEVSGLATSEISLHSGVNRVMATAYQSCRAVDLPAMDSGTAAVDGITRLAQNHPDGVGGKRVISNLKAVQNTHYYIRGIATESSCVKVRDNPMIYDYGGEPSITDSTLNFFKDAGTGTKALGIDCSAFVSSAIAVSGYRYKPNLANKPIYTRQTSTKFISAENSGFTCFENVTVTPKQSILSGDIVGVNGHVVIVDRIGHDPFGLTSINKVSDCANLNYKNFDIDVAQSSPSKNGIGINKFKLSDYLDETTKMRVAFVDMAEQSCLAKFQNKNLKPKNSAWGFLRHKATPECQAPRVSLGGESCAKSCF